MKVNFQWYEKYATGVDEIDFQHKKFLKIIQKTYQLKEKNTEDKEVFKLIDELIKYATYHFACEEIFMKIYAYPKLNNQIKEHNKIKNDLKERVEKIKRQEEDVADLMFFLMTWFINHTSGSDKDIGEYMRVHNETIYGI